MHQSFHENELVTSTISEDSYTPLSETVTTLASNVYKELERIIKNFGENSVKDLMPVMIATLGRKDLLVSICRKTSCVSSSFRISG